MKKIIFIISIIVLSSQLFSEEIIFFQGIMSKLGEPDTVTGEIPRTDETSIESQVEYVHNKYLNKDTVVIAHSQGGVRALGYAYKAQKNVKALITIGSPVKGYSPLVVGENVLMSRIDKVVGDLSGGLSALLLGPYSIPPVRLNSNNAFGIMDAFGFEDPLLNNIKTGEIFNKEGIKDLNPNSDYFKNYVNPKLAQKSFKKLVKYKKKLVRKVKYVKVGWFRVPKVSFSWTYGYKYVTKNYVVPQNRIDSSIPIGFIVGTQNDPIEFLDSKGQQTARKVSSGLSIAFDVGNVFHTAYGVLTKPIFWTNTSRNYFRNAKACRTAKRLVANPEKILGDIFGSTANDSFILESDQKRSLTGLGGTPIGKNGEFYVRKNVNHLQEMSDDEIWGIGDNYSLSKGAFDKGSQIEKWLSYQNIYKTSGTVVK
ncbi:hypothetical protein EW093_06890 [Thiospirochaeta perfilievii]|uniref:Alpha/beta hydrolase n=1 Tax=Thiospirochaeta perfilievii TaxID=252967 RepID=A0A5C1QCM7_9SPIO|nr:hypothetical protein [Thiospirochaeta perfilievii]QEN04434.1 hypothetical protein EW093_06890 [Thiospirochaeta perfilievii]